MAGARVETEGRDLIEEVIAARKAAAKIPEDRAKEERAAIKLFSNLTKLARKYVPSDQLPELPPLPDGLTEEERNEELSRRNHQQFMAEIARRNEISRADHFLDATITKGEETVKVQIQLQPSHGDVSLEEPAAFIMSLPDSTIDDVLTVREKSLEGDPATVTRLLFYLLTYPTTQICYRKQSRTSFSS